MRACQEVKDCCMIHGEKFHNVSVKVKDCFANDLESVGDVFVSIDAR